VRAARRGEGRKITICQPVQHRLLLLRRMRLINNNGALNGSRARGIKAASFTLIEASRAAPIVHSSEAQPSSHPSVYQFRNISL
jgi:hypothetical protein